MCLLLHIMTDNNWQETRKKSGFELNAVLAMLYCDLFLTKIKVISRL